MRWLIFLHRYLGIGIGWMIALWCLSGLVMIYVPYPELSFEEHLAALPPIELDGCCLEASSSDWSDDDVIVQFSVEMLLGEPTVTLQDRRGFTWRTQLVSGRYIDGIDADEALAIATERTRHLDGVSEPSYLGEVDVDQWTVGTYRSGPSLYRVALNDRAGTQWYIDAGDGQLVQDTTARERFWNWAGAVVHWIYPTALRSNGPLWSRIVISSSIVALFLTILGLYIGIARLRRRPPGRVSPYRGMALWHHMLGLVCGVAALTWLLSGLLSMNPWGLLVGGGARAETARLAATTLTGRDVGRLLDRLATAALPPGTTYIESAPLNGRVYLLAFAGNGAVTRLDAADFRPAPLTSTELDAAAAALRPDTPPASIELIDGPDAYYYSHHAERAFPVLRVRFDGADAARYYLDASTGQLLAKLDADGRAYRWLFSALHSLDFAAIVRQRPLWDAIMWILLLGVTGLSLTGFYLGIRYLRR